MRPGPVVGTVLVPTRPRTHSFSVLVYPESAEEEVSAVREHAGEGVWEHLVAGNVVASVVRSAGDELISRVERILDDL
jgi:hypothetical protein